MSGNVLRTKGKFVTFNRIQCRVVTGLLRVITPWGRHVYLLELLDSPLCRKCGVREETTFHIILSARLCFHSDLRTCLHFLGAGGY